MAILIRRAVYRCTQEPRQRILAGLLLAHGIGLGDRLLHEFCRGVLLCPTPEVNAEIFLQLDRQSTIDR